MPISFIYKVSIFITIGELRQTGRCLNTIRKRSINFGSRYDGNFNYNRYNYRANLDVDFTKTTLLTVNLGGRVEKRNYPQGGDNLDDLFRHIYWALPFGGPGIIDGKWITGNKQYIPVLGENVSYADGMYNTYGRGYSTKTTNVLNLDLALSQKLDFLTKGLNFKIKFAYNSSYIQNR